MIVKFSDHEINIRTNKMDLPIKVTVDTNDLTGLVTSVGSASKSFDVAANSSEKLNTSLKEQSEGALAAIGNISFYISEVSALASSVASKIFSFANVGKQFEFATDTAAAFGKIDINTEAGREEVEKLSAAAREFGVSGRFAFGATDIMSNAIVSLKLAGASTEDVLGGVLETVLQSSTALGLSLADSVSLIIGNMKVFGVEASKTSDVVDKLAYAVTTSDMVSAQMVEATQTKSAVAFNSVGWTFESLAASIGILANAQIKGSVAGTSLAAMLQGVTSAGADVKELMEGIKFNPLDQFGNVKDYVTFFKDLNVSMEGMATGTKADVMARIFGSSGMGTAEILRKSVESGEFEKYLNDITNNSKNAGEQMSTLMASNLSTLLITSKSTMDELFLVVYDGLNPVLKYLVTQYIKTLTFITNLLRSIGHAVMYFVQTFSTAFAPAKKALQPLFDALSPLIVKIESLFSTLSDSGGQFEGIINAGGFLGHVFGKILSVAVTGLIPLLSFLSDVLISIFSLDFNLPSLDSILAAFTLLVLYSKQVYDYLLQILSTASSISLSQLTSSFSSLLSYVSNIYYQLTSLFDVDSFKNAGVNIISSVIDGMKSHATPLIESLKGMLQRVRNLLPFSPPADSSSPLTGLEDSGESIVDSVMNGLKSGFDGMINFVKPALRSVSNSIEGPIGEIVGWVVARLLTLPIVLATVMASMSKGRLAMPSLSGIMLFFGALGRIALGLLKFASVIGIVGIAIFTLVENGDAIAQFFANTGDSIIGNIGKGLLGGVSWLVNTFKTVLQRLRDLLPFSPPADSSSPLTGLEDSGESIVDSIVNGMISAKNNVIAFFVSLGVFIIDHIGFISKVVATILGRLALTAAFTSLHNIKLPSSVGLLTFLNILKNILFFVLKLSLGFSGLIGLIIFFASAGYFEDSFLNRLGSVGETIKKIRDKFIGLFQYIKENAGVGMFSNAFNGVTSVISKVYAAVKSVVSGIIVLLNPFFFLLKAGIDNFENRNRIASNLAKNLKKVWNVIKDIFSFISNALATLFNVFQRLTGYSPHLAMAAAVLFFAFVYTRIIKLIKKIIREVTYAMSFTPDYGRETVDRMRRHFRDLSGTIRDTLCNSGTCLEKPTFFGKLTNFFRGGLLATAGRSMLWIAESLAKGVFNGIRYGALSGFNFAVSQTPRLMGMLKSIPGLFSALGSHLASEGRRVMVASRPMLDMIAREFPPFFQKMKTGLSDVLVGFKNQLMSVLGWFKNRFLSIWNTLSTGSPPRIGTAQQRLLGTIGVGPRNAIGPTRSANEFVRTRDRARDAFQSPGITSSYRSSVASPARGAVSSFIINKSADAIIGTARLAGVATSKIAVAYTAMQTRVVAGFAIMRVTSLAAFSATRVYALAAFSAIRVYSLATFAAIKIAALAPFVPFILGAAAAVAAIYLVYSYWGTFWNYVSSLVSSSIGYVIKVLLNFKVYITQLFGIGSIFGGLINSFVDIFINMFTLIKALFNGFFLILTGNFSEGGIALVNALIDGMKSMLGTLYDMVYNLFANVFDLLLPHSDAIEGPLSTLTASGAAVPQTLADGMLGNADVLYDTTEQLAANANPLGQKSQQPRTLAQGVELASTKASEATNKVMNADVMSLREQAIQSTTGYIEDAITFTGNAMADVGNLFAEENQKVVVEHQAFVEKIIASTSDMIGSALSSTDGNYEKYYVSVEREKKAKLEELNLDIQPAKKAVMELLDARLKAESTALKSHENTIAKLTGDLKVYAEESIQVEKDIASERKRQVDDTKARDKTAVFKKIDKSYVKQEVTLTYEEKVAKEAAYEKLTDKEKYEFDIATEKQNKLDEQQNQASALREKADYVRNELSQLKDQFESKLAAASKIEGSSDADIEKIKEAYKEAEELAKKREELVNELSGISIEHSDIVESSPELSELDMAAVNAGIGKGTVDSLMTQAYDDIVRSMDMFTERTAKATKELDLQQMSAEKIKESIQGLNDKKAEIDVTVSDPKEAKELLDKLATMKSSLLREDLDRSLESEFMQINKPDEKGGVGGEVAVRSEVIKGFASGDVKNAITDMFGTVAVDLDKIKQEVASNGSISFSDSNAPQLGTNSIAEIDWSNGASPTQENQQATKENVFRQFSDETKDTLVVSVATDEARLKLDELTAKYKELGVVVSNQDMGDGVIQQTRFKDVSNAEKTVADMQQKVNNGDVTGSELQAYQARIDELTAEIERVKALKEQEAIDNAIKPDEKVEKVLEIKPDTAAIDAAITKIQEPTTSKHIIDIEVVGLPGYISDDTYIKGGRIVGYSSGGVTDGKISGFSRVDNMLGMVRDKIIGLAGGEYIINPLSTRLFEPLLNLINYNPKAALDLLNMQHFNMGGLTNAVVNSASINMPKQRDNLSPVVVNIKGRETTLKGLYADKDIAVTVINQFAEMIRGSY